MYSLNVYSRGLLIILGNFYKWRLFEIFVFNLNDSLILFWRSRLSILDFAIENYKIIYYKPKNHLD